jgi:prolipoprotein diacylglyceryl transferase
MFPAAFLGYIPSPPANGISIGPLRLHAYGLLIACGIAAAVWLAQRRWSRIGGAPGTMATLAVWGVPGGLIGARLYSLATSWGVDTGHDWVRAFEIWRGGLGIWGAVVGGIITGGIGAHRMKLPFKPLVDSVAPAFALGQAIGRWGNYFNQELFGWPSKLPWALEISPPQRPPHYLADATFQPTFLYECIWDLGVVVALIWAERRFRIRRGYLIFPYAFLYTFGRFWTEYMRVDPADRFGGLRLNDWTAIAVFIAALTIFVLRGRAAPGKERSGDPLPGTPAAAASEATAESSTPAAGAQAGVSHMAPVTVHDSPGVGPRYIGPPEGRSGPD